MEFFIIDFFSKCDKIHRKLRIWIDLMNKSLMEIFCAVISELILRYQRTTWQLQIGILIKKKKQENMRIERTLTQVFFLGKFESFSRECRF